MRIEDLKKESTGPRARISAKVIWEDCGRPPFDLYIETEPEFESALSLNPHAFLVACIMPALHYGEKRVLLDADICPELKIGLETAMGWIRHWFYTPAKELVKIDAKTRSSMPLPRTPGRAGFFFSGGIDSFATLKANRLNYPFKHPLSIRDGILVYGLEMDEPEAFVHVRESLSGMASEMGIELMPVYTNLYLNYRDEDARNGFNFWTNKFMGSALAAVAHAFSGRLTAVSIASSFDIPNLGPHGLNPILNQNYSSADLRIINDGLNLTRLQKVMLLSRDNAVLRNLRVCNHFKRYRAGNLNCGRCEKCLRTMLALVSAGALRHTDVFPCKDVTREMVREFVFIKDSFAFWYTELSGALKKAGRPDLAAAVDEKIEEYQHGKSIKKIKRMIKHFDDKFLSGHVVKINRIIIDRAKVLK